MLDLQMYLQDLIASKDSFSLTFCHTLVITV
jgi:hypothetical protein